jgi:Leucine-rich repeat (LRR) protein
MRKYVIFKLNNLNNEHLQLSVEEAIESYILPNIIRQFYRQEKESIVLGDRLTNGIIQSVLKVGSAESKEKITKLFLDHNQITDISYIAKDFANLQILELSNSSPI